ncbi:MAG: hypothetical protein EU544_06155 [Promethearchaeota archaeon]|nr:MAG: hypothetical protein EU544_06155 [Candidatus Lokiarchaeota archaeon]
MDADSNKMRFCFNCETEIIDKKQKKCPNCQMILRPNGYVDWASSWYLFISLLCIVPIVFILIHYIFRVI